VYLLSWLEDSPHYGWLVVIVLVVENLGFGPTCK
jgi:hypothetical protein